jgi:[acyl-carrier-protein] S-malonyltransferase
MRDPVPVAFVFPGQGAFRPGCLDAWGGHPAAALLGEVSEALERDIRQVAADPATGRRTADAQPAILAASLVAWRAVTDAGLRPTHVAGHSLGEIAAAVAAGALTVVDAARLVEVRGRSMARACAQRPGTMAALVRLEPEQIDRLVEDVDGAVVANDNAPGQVVVAGSEQAVHRLAELAREAGGRVLSIEVEGAFHSPAMEPAVPAVAELVDGLELRDPEIPLVSGTSASPLTTAAQIRSALVEGILAPVRWREVQLELQARGVTTLVELGPGGVLKGLAKRTVRDLEVLTVASPEQVEPAMAALTVRAR